MSNKFGGHLKKIKNQRIIWDLRTLKSRQIMPSKSICAFIHVPKTAGQSVYYELEARLGMVSVLSEWQLNKIESARCFSTNHLIWPRLLKAGRIREGFADSAWKFAVVRNPYARAVSAYNYNSPDKWSFQEFLNHARNEIDAFNDTESYRPKSSHFLPQSSFLFDDVGSLVCDAVFSLDRLQDLDKELERKFGVPTNIADRRQNVSRKFMSLGDLKKDESLLRMVETIYQRDFDLLRAYFQQTSF